MEELELELDDLLKKNPHLDAKKVKRHKARRDRDRRRATPGGRTSPFGKKPDREEAWNNNDPGARPHYRAG
jgi:hypothetical protein